MQHGSPPWVPCTVSARSTSHIPGPARGLSKAAATSCTTAPDLYPDPERFDPERWNPATGNHTRRVAFIPFGAGARMCIADKFAVTEAILALATITARWQLHTMPHQDLRPALSVVPRPRRLRMQTTLRPKPQH
ncbi:cytochrome P450 [Nocardia terpenica]|uniref:cytochrome P450 n=1 Tax=Nocardia terpenica TaxID=455432 RepID=UPI001EEBDD76|nr:cytochrome P450 [Nocardia terpenica]